MPVTITGTRAASTIQAPLDGEAGDASDLVTTTIQPIANNIAQINGRLRFGTLVQMVAATGVQQDDIWHTEQGAYVADAASLVRNAPWEYACSGTPAFTWRSTLFDLFVGASGIARFGPITGIDAATPNGKLPVINQTNPVIYTAQLTTSTFLTQALSASATATVALSQFADLQTGDILSGSLGPIWVRNYASTTPYIRLQFVDDFGGTGVATVDRFTMIPPSVSPAPFSSSVTFPFQHEVTVSGTTRIQLSLTAGNNVLAVDGFEVVDNNIGNITIYRP